MWKRYRTESSVFFIQNADFNAKIYKKNPFRQLCFRVCVPMLIIIFFFFISCSLLRIFNYMMNARVNFYLLPRPFRKIHTILQENIPVLMMIEYK